MRVITLYSGFNNVGGAQNVALQIAVNVNNDKPIVLSKTMPNNVDAKYKDVADFRLLSFKQIKHLADNETVFFSHHRKITTLLMLYKILLGDRLHIVHIAHSTFDNLRFVSLFPNNIVAVSNGVKQNLINYFHRKPSNITVIYNGLSDKYTPKIYRNDGKIKILFVGRICGVKRQLDFVKYSKGKIPYNVEVLFAGKGEDEEALKREILDDSHYKYLGYVNPYEWYNKVDYTLLFSEKEGFALSLVESCMFGIPILTNKLDVFKEINEHGITGFSYEDFESLVYAFKNLPQPDSIEYRQMSLAARHKYLNYWKEEKMIEQYKKVIIKELQD